MHIVPKTPKLFAVKLPEQGSISFAPMEGVTDHSVRDLMTRTGGFDFCVSEFIRISQGEIPSHVFLRDVPEIANHSKTFSGAFVVAQILGGNSNLMAISAVNAMRAGAKAIDINFGCPAPTVNNNDGGATLLKYPERIQEIVSAVREALPPEVSVSAKLRLGWDSIDAIYENASRAAKGGASWITIHGRTRVAGYTPPAYWKPIGEVQKSLDIPVIANGEIWNIDDFKRCVDESGCKHFMLGRGALANPALALQARKHLGLPTLSQTVLPPKDFSPQEWHHFLEHWAEMPDARNSPPRIKQWIRYVNMAHPVAWWDQIRSSPDPMRAFHSLYR